MLRVSENWLIDIQRYYYDDDYLAQHQEARTRRWFFLKKLLQLLKCFPFFFLLFFLFWMTRAWDPVSLQCVLKCQDLLDIQSTYLAILYALLAVVTFLEHLPFTVAWELITCMGRREGSMWAMLVRKWIWQIWWIWQLWMYPLIGIRDVYNRSPQGLYACNHKIRIK